MTATIHPTACIDDNATIGNDVTIGPYCIIGPNVTLGDGCQLHSHVVIEGHTTIGKHNQFFPFSAIGLAPQDLKYNGEASRLEIGDNNKFREHVTVHTGTENGGMVTKIGNSCLLMIGVHIAHDCRLSDRIILANNATLAGHVEVGNNAVIGGLAAIHQFVRIGHHAMIGGMSGIENDVIPYGQATGERAGLVGLNLIGIKRSNLEKTEVNGLRNAYKLLFNSDENTFDTRVNTAEEQFADVPQVMEMIQFIRDKKSRDMCFPKK